MNNNQFVETYYNDIKNACAKYYNMINSYIEYEDFLQQTYCIFLKRNLLMKIIMLNHLHLFVQL